jgi:hypothetical protein
MFGEIKIGAYERGLWFKDGQFQELLGPGDYHFDRDQWRVGGDHVQVVNTLDGRFEHPQLDSMLTDDLIRQSLHVVELKDFQRALAWKDGQLGWILGPGRHAFWREPADLTVEPFNVQAFRFSHPQLERILAFPGASRFFAAIAVGPGERVTVLRDGTPVETIGVGLHAFWRCGEVTFQRNSRPSPTADATQAASDNTGRRREHRPAERMPANKAQVPHAKCPVGVAEGRRVNAKCKMQNEKWQ